MKRFFKLLLSILGGLIALMLIAILIIVFVINPNDYKTQIADFVKNATGRTLIIKGDIKLTFYPWLGLNLGEVSLGNAPGFEAPNFAKIDLANVGIKVLPLLNKKIEIDTISLYGAHITLTRKPNGQTNWDDLVTENSQPKESTHIGNFKIDGLDLRHAQIIWDDQQAGSRYELSDVNINTSAIRLNEPIKFQFNATAATSGAMTLNGKIKLDSQITLNLENQQFRIAPFTVTLQSEQIPEGTISINTQTIEVDLKQQTAMLSGLAAEVMDALLIGDVQANHVQTNPTLSGEIKLVGLNLQKVLKQFNLQNLPGEKLLEMLGFEAQFEANLAKVSLKNIHLRLDDNHLTTPEININLDQKTLNADALSLELLGINLNAQVKLKQIFSQPTGTAQLNIAPFNPRLLLKRLEQAQLLSELSLPDEKVLPLKTATLKTQFELHQANEVSIKNLHLHLDDNQLKIPQINVDLNKETLDSQTFSLHALGMNLKAQVQVQQLFSNLKAQAKLTLGPFNPQKVLKRLGQKPLVLPAPFKLRNATLRTHLSVTPKDVTINNLRFTVDEHHLKTKQIKFNIAKDTLILKHLTLKTLGATLYGNLFAKQVSTQLALQGSLNVPAFNPRYLLRRLGQPLKTTDPRALRTLSLQTRLQGGLSQLRLDQLKIRLDESTLKGNIRVQDFQNPAIAFYMMLDNIDIDRYLPPPQKTESQKSKPPLSGEVVLAPLGLLRALNLNGIFKVDELKAAKITINNIYFDVSAKQGKIHLTPRAALYQGTYHGNIMLDAQHNPPHIRVDQTMRNVQASPLLKDLVGNNQITGTANMTTKLTSEITSTTHIQNSLTGTIRFFF